MTQVKIDKNIPLPATYGKYSKYPFGDMKKGDSFLIDSQAETTAVRQAASYYSRSTGTKMKFSIRKTDKGHRCWRVE
jgi:hypothetical protein